MSIWPSKSSALISRVVVPHNDQRSGETTAEALRKAGRDIILISTVYGKTADGSFHQRFGPINSAFGHRRLNVLFTRAKRRLGLFTSLDPAQIVSDGKARGSF
jgi:hypothetical protein